jgi:hypothetical protein
LKNPQKHWLEVEVISECVRKYAKFYHQDAKKGAYSSLFFPMVDKGEQWPDKRLK